MDAAEYAKAYQIFGGSVHTSPAFVAATSELLGLEAKYIASYDASGALIGALPRWGRSQFGDAGVMSLCAKGPPFDWGQMEIIYPLSADVTHTLPPGPSRLSELHKDNVTHQEPMPGMTQALFRTEEFGGQSGKFHRRHRYMLNRFLKQGGEIWDVDDIPGEDFAYAYAELHQLRHDKPPAAFAGVLEFAKRWPEQLCGKVLVSDSRPVAVQLLVWAECERWVSVEYINGGFDTSMRDVSVGSVLLYVNTTSLEEYAKSKGKGLRYSFGYSHGREENLGYKARYCARFPVYTMTRY